MKALFSSKAFVWAVIAIVAGAILYGIVLSGTPGEQRASQLDQRRVSDLQQLAFAIDEYWARNQELPTALKTLQDSRHYYVSSLEDPETQEPYEYSIVGDKTYKLCASFATAQTNQGKGVRGPFAPFWEHAQGRACFELEVQPRQAD